MGLPLGIEFDTAHRVAAQAQLHAARQVEPVADPGSDGKVGGLVDQVVEQPVVESGDGLFERLAKPGHFAAGEVSPLHRQLAAHRGAEAVAMQACIRVAGAGPVEPPCALETGRRRKEGRAGHASSAGACSSGITPSESRPSRPVRV